MAKDIDHEPAVDHDVIPEGASDRSGRLETTAASSETQETPPESLPEAETRLHQESEPHKASGPIFDAPTAAAPSNADDAIGLSNLFSMAGGEDADGASVVAPSGTAIPQQRIGDYQLLQKLGEGGMGSVFVARQESADRIVALKVIRSDHLVQGGNDTIVNRFQTEARAAAKLEHDHIVTVFDIGYRDGQHYFSMRLINGSSAAELLRDGPLENRRAARYALGICKGIAHAHQNGILHRDLKPQNILIDAASDRAMITDFGLAKFVRGDDELTRHGEVIGTPAYMSPEQALESGNVELSADIYSIGVTLYHFLTGRPPFQAATPIETLNQVIHQEAVRPRVLNSGIDRDLETICLKCIEKRPIHRYQTAQEVVDELERCLAGQPIVARPLGPLRRFAKRCRRHPVVAGLSFATAAALLVAVGALSYGLLASQNARAKTEASFDMALGAVDKFYTRVSEEALLDQPGLQLVRRRLLNESLSFYQRLVRNQGNDPRLATEIARAHFRIGWITRQLHSPEDAMPHYLEALSRQQRLLQSRPSSRLKEDLSDTWNAIGVAHHRLGRYEDARSAYQQSLELRDAWAGSSADPDAPRKRANSRMNLGLLDGDDGDVDNAVKQFADAQEIRLALLNQYSDENRGEPSKDIVSMVQRDLAKGYFNWSNLLKDNGLHYQDVLETAVVKLERLHQDHPIDQEASFHLAESLRLLGDARASGKAAMSDYLQALGLVEPLARQNPSVIRFQREWAVVLLRVAERHFADGDYTQSASRLDQAIQRLKPLVSDNSIGREMAELLQLAETAREAAQQAMK